MKQVIINEPGLVKQIFLVFLFLVMLQIIVYKEVADAFDLDYIDPLIFLEN